MIQAGNASQGTQRLMKFSEEALNTQTSTSDDDKKKVHKKKDDDIDNAPTDYNSHQSHIFMVSTTDPVTMVDCFSCHWIQHQPLPP